MRDGAGLIMIEFKLVNIDRYSLFGGLFSIFFLSNLVSETIFTVHAYKHTKEGFECISNFA